MDVYSDSMPEVSRDVVERVEQALRLQRCSVKAYELMLAGGAPPADRQLLQTMRREERRHYYLLEGIFEDLTGRPYRAGALHLSLPRQYIAMLKVMICDKLEGIELYQQLATDLRCVKQRELVEIIISDQKEQARILAAVYRRNGA